MAASRMAEASGTLNQNSAPTMRLATSAPMKPAQVLLGETLGHSLAPPSRRPAMKPAVSAATTMTITKTTASSPSEGSARSQIRATAGRPA